MNVQVKSENVREPAAAVCTITDKPYGSISSPDASSPKAASRSSIEHDGLTGVTSNPSIFEKAIAGSADYDSLAEGGRNSGRPRRHGALRAARDRGHPARRRRAASGL